MVKLLLSSHNVMFACHHCYKVEQAMRALKPVRIVSRPCKLVQYETSPSAVPGICQTISTMPTAYSGRDDVWKL